MAVFDTQDPLTLCFGILGTVIRVFVITNMQPKYQEGAADARKMLVNHLGLTLTREDLQNVVDLMEPYRQITNVSLDGKYWLTWSLLALLDSFCRLFSTFSFCIWIMRELPPSMAISVPRERRTLAFESVIIDRVAIAELQDLQGKRKSREKLSHRFITLSAMLLNLRKPTYSLFATGTCHIQLRISGKGSSRKIHCCLKSKIWVNGPKASALYKFFKAKKRGLCGSRIKWNFTKFLWIKVGSLAIMDHLLHHYLSRYSESVRAYNEANDPVKFNIRDP
ncbi:glutathione peroxidase 5 [Artemisia annua]|uniref:Glutathione peroxidase 5 n=1 Tax=Artemisia annua TaxID=35608 RepID=A0A2U1MP90_ARTAN|nr:glutathione peroxidase 5 [Artemisia annua]